MASLKEKALEASLQRKEENTRRQRREKAITGGISGAVSGGIINALSSGKSGRAKRAIRGALVGAAAIAPATVVSNYAEHRIHTHEQRKKLKEIQKSAELVEAVRELYNG